MRASTTRSNQALYLQARAIVRRHYRADLTLDVVARALASSPRQIQRAYKDVGAIRFSEQLTTVRLAAAAELLEWQAIPVRDIARLVGYRQPPQFAKAFRRHYGRAPAEYRRLARARRSTPAPDAGKSRFR